MLLLKESRGGAGKLERDDIKRIAACGLRAAQTGHVRKGQSGSTQWETFMRMQGLVVKTWIFRASGSKGSTVHFGFMDGHKPFKFGVRRNRKQQTLRRSYPLHLRPFCTLRIPKGNTGYAGDTLSGGKSVQS